MVAESATLTILSCAGFGEMESPNMHAYNKVSIFTPASSHAETVRRVRGAGQPRSDSTGASRSVIVLLPRAQTSQYTEVAIILGPERSHLSAANSQWEGKPPHHTKIVEAT